MNIEFEPTEEDWVVGFRDFGRRRASLASPAETPQRRSVIVFATLTLLLFVAPNFLPREQDPWRYPAAAAAGFFAALAFLSYKSLQAFSANALEASVRRLAATADGKYLVERHAVEIDPQWFRVRTATFEQALSWARVPAVSRAGDRFVVYRQISATIAAVTVVPRRAFATDAEFDEFCRLAEGFWRAAHPGV
ncbi:MAG TPA: hypothetical protein VF170_02355 [Planctomycetaceae bacterium]